MGILDTPAQSLVQANRDRFRRESALRGKIPVTTAGRGSYAGSGSSQSLCLSDGTQQSAMHRFPLKVTADATNLQVGFGNFAYNAVGPNDIRIKASIETPAGVVHKLYFSGQRIVTIEPGGLVITDPTSGGLEVAKGDTIFLRMLVAVEALGNKWPQPSYYFVSRGGGWATPGTNVVDSSGGVSGNDSTRGYGPAFVVGTPKTLTTPGVAIIGDSIDWGTGDSAVEPIGWIERALNEGYGYINLARPSELVNDIVRATTSQMREFKLPQILGCTHAVVKDGTNDLGAGETFAQVQADLQTLYGWLNNAGIKVIGVTLPPRTTSTDSWATTGNQTPTASNADRILLNNWIRTTPSPLIGYLELADVYESARDSGLWKVGPVLTGDGTHPNTQGHTNGGTGLSSAVASLLAR